jgi:hypothetical protein
MRVFKKYARNLAGMYLKKSDLNLLPIFEIPLSSRHEKQCQILKRLFGGVGSCRSSTGYAELQF